MTKVTEEREQGKEDNAILQSRSANNRGDCALLRKGHDVCESREGFVSLNLTEDTKFHHGIYFLTNQPNDRALHESHSKLSH